MSRYTLGVDTSNYATSLAVFDTAGEVVCAKKRFLPVKAGQLGLRQSDALFHHTAALPEMLQELAQEFDLTKIDAVGVSQKPRPVEGSLRWSRRQILPWSPPAGPSAAAWCPRRP